jgi:hypothetical protein
MMFLMMISWERNHHAWKMLRMSNTDGTSKVRLATILLPIGGGQTGARVPSGAGGATGADTGAVGRAMTTRGGNGLNLGLGLVGMGVGALPAKIAVADLILVASAEATQNSELNWSRTSGERDSWRYCLFVSGTLGSRIMRM